MITMDGAARLVGMLVVTTTGWNDDNVNATCVLIHQKWKDADAANDAIQQVIDSWSSQGRPPWGVIHQAYNDAVRRRALATPALGSGNGGRIISVPEGKKVALRAYTAECRRQGKEPNQATIDSFLGIVGTSAQEEADAAHEARRMEDDRDTTIGGGW